MSIYDLKYNRVHQKPLIECDSCSKKFVFVSDLKAHKIEKHPVTDFDEGNCFHYFGDNRKINDFSFCLLCNFNYLLCNTK